MLQRMQILLILPAKTTLSKSRVRYIVYGCSLIPSEKSIADFVEKNCPPSQWNLNFLQILLESLSFSSGRYYSTELSPEGGTILSNSNIDATYSIKDGKL